MGCSNSTFLAIEDEVFAMLKVIAATDIQLAEQYLQAWLQKNISPADTQTMQGIVTAAK